MEPSKSPSDLSSEGNSDGSYASQMRADARHVLRCGGSPAAAARYAQICDELRCERDEHQRNQSSRSSDKSGGTMRKNG